MIEGKLGSRSEAARIAEDETAKVRYLGRAAFQYERIDRHKRATELLNEMRNRAGKNPKLLPLLISALTEIADIKNDRDYQLALLEYQIEEVPSDTRKRFSLAYLHSQNQNGDVALFHYQIIPTGQRSPETWNNLGVSYGEAGMPVKAVRAFERSVEDGNTLAMSNLGNKLLASGFSKEANELCKRALAATDFDKNVPTLLNRLQVVDDEEDQKLKEALEKVKAKAAFYRELGKNAVVETPTAIAKTWAAREGTLTAQLTDDQFKLIGNYEMPASGLTAVLGIATPVSEKYLIEYSGYLCGRMFSGTVTRTREGVTAGLWDFPSKTLMYFSPDGTILNVMENASSPQPTFCELRAVGQGKP